MSNGQYAIGNRQLAPKAFGDNWQWAISNRQMIICEFSYLLYALLIAYCLLPISSKAQVISLDSVLNNIERNNPMLKMYDEQILAIQENAEMAKAWMPPTLSTGPWQIPYNSFKDGMWMLTGEQMIPNPSKQKANYNYMRGMAPVEQLSKGSKKNELFALAKQNYYEWIVFKKKYAVLVQTDSLLNYIAQVAQLRYTYNKEKLNTIYKAHADLYELRNMESMVLYDIRMKNVELNTLMNLDKSFVFDVDTVIHSQNYELQLPDTTLISSVRSDIKLFDASIGLIRLQQQYEISKQYPEFGISISHMQSLGTLPNQYAAMGMMTLPIVPWASKEYKSKIKSLDYSVNTINFQKQALINETAGRIASLQTQINSTKQQLNNFKINIIPTYYKSYQTSMIAYEQNTEDLFVVLDGLRMYRMAKMNELDQLNILMKLQVDYEKEMEIR